MAAEDGQNETSPLLAEAAFTNASQPASVQSANQKTVSATRTRQVIILTATFILIYQLVDVLTFAPSVRLYELAYCRRYWTEHDPSVIDLNGNIPEALCKHPSVQSKLSGLRAWLGSIEGFLGLAVIVPYGILADKKGARLVLSINVLGYFLATIWLLVVCHQWTVFPIEAVVLSAVFRAIGGGGPVVVAVLLAILAAVVPPAQRSTVFFWMSAAELIVDATAPFLTAILLDHGFIFSSIVLCLPLELLGLFIVFSMPSNAAKAEEQGPSSEEPSASPEQTSSKVSNKTRLAACLPLFTILKFGYQMLEVLVQYTSQKFGWTIAKANTLLSARALANIALLLFILPSITVLLQRSGRTYSATVLDLRIAQVSAFLLAVGSLSLGLVQTIPLLVLGLLVFTGGNGCREALQSYITSFVSREEIARLYTLVAFADGTGTMLGAAIMNGSLQLALGKDWAPMGLPFFVAAALYGCGTILLCSV